MSKGNSNGYRVIARGAAVTMSNRPGDRPVQRPCDRPGIVILIHGVNDCAGWYESVEKGLCTGVNERLSRRDLAPGIYGSYYRKAARNRQPRTAGDNYLNDPDTYLYRRSEDAGTYSLVIPFYWGHRASNEEIACIDDPGEVKSRQVDANGYLMTRGEYQDKKGNRLDRNFAKGGGFFANATNNIPDMYDTHFQAPWIGKAVTKTGAAPRYTYIADGPERRYYVLAAERLASLISTIRNIPPSSEARAEGVDPAHDTITIVAHSQGSIISLLAQALLAQRGQRCVDCLIMIDSPYSVHTTDKSEQTGRAKLKTLVDIVNTVTSQPYAIPDLADLLVECMNSGGRTGVGWTPTQGRRKDQMGKEVTFAERDNRGKVYLYFCPEDTVVALSHIHGIGTFGVPDEVDARHYYRDPDRSRPQRGRQMLPAMKALETTRFFQRMWTRMERDHDGDGKFRKVPVGLPPARVPVREQHERLAAGPEAGRSLAGSAVTQAQNWITTAAHTRNEIRHINGEALTPPHEPELYGAEVIRGGPRPGHADVAGILKPDDIEKNIALGNQYASYDWIEVGTTMDPFTNLDTYRNRFNDHKELGDQTHNWRLVPRTLLPGYLVQREQTPNEAREKMSGDKSMWMENNYHGAILRSSENHRWVTAMDIAIGQAVSIDDPVWRDLLIRMADWRLTKKEYDQLKGNGRYETLVRFHRKAAELIEASYRYYTTGRFPDESLVPLKTMPPLVTSETVAQQENPPALPPTPHIDFSGLSR